MYKTREEFRTQSYDAPYRARTSSYGKDDLWNRLNYSSPSSPAYTERYAPLPREERRSGYGVERRDFERTYRGSEKREENYGRTARRESFADGIPVGGNFDYYTKDETMPRIRQNVKKKHSKMPAKIKALAIVYALIVVAIMTLVLINTIPAANAATVPAGSSYELPEEALGKAITESGTQDLAPVNKTDGYTYDTSTNAFDKICDWMENLVG